MKIIFLDIDGVLNGHNIFTEFLFYIYSFWNIPLYEIIDEAIPFRKPYYSVHEDKMKRLSDIIDNTGAKVVLTSSRRTTIYKYYQYHLNNPEFDDYLDEEIKDIVLKFFEYDIPVIGITEEKHGRRFTDIYSYVEDNKERLHIENFIILDDEYNHLGFYYNRMDKYSVAIITSDNRPGKEIQGRWYCREGLRNSHVKRAIKKLNGDPITRYS